jgi:hypothetical protein
MAAHRVAFGLAVVFLLAAAPLFILYQQSRDAHIRVVATALSVEARTTRVNSNVAQRLFHPLLRVPLADGSESIISLKQGFLRPDNYPKGISVEVIYPHGHPEDVRIPQALDSLWPSLTLLAMALAALVSALLLRREAVHDIPAKKEE